MSQVTFSVYLGISCAVIPLDLAMLMIKVLHFQRWQAYILNNLVVILATSEIGKFVRNYRNIYKNEIFLPICNLFKI